jgi:hypothetical protein
MGFWRAESTARNTPAGHDVHFAARPRGADRKRSLVPACLVAARCAATAGEARHAGPGRSAAKTHWPRRVPDDRWRRRIHGAATPHVRPVWLIVSKHDADTWWDWIHEASNDKLNVTDLCVVWGANARSGIYRDIQFSSGEFVCYASTSSNAVWAQFDMASLSNNHLLTDDPAIVKVLKRMRVGDQVHFRGYLAEYSHHHGFAFFRGTSITRLDTGNGACETVFATDAQIVKPGNPGWRFTFWAAAAVFVAGIVGWVLMPYRVND